MVYCRQEDGVPHSMAASVTGDLPPLSRTGSPTNAEKDILVRFVCCYIENMNISFIDKKMHKVSV